MIRDLMLDEGIIDKIKFALDLNILPLTKQLCKLTTALLSSPDQMRLWLKFDAGYRGLDSAVSRNSRDSEGNRGVFGSYDETSTMPAMIPKGRGIYRNWGAFFDFGNVLELIGGLEICSKEGPDAYQWSLTFWTVLPIVYPTE